MLLAFSILANRMCAHHSPHPHQGWHHITARSCSHDVLCEGNQAHRTLRGMMPPGGSETGRRPRSGPGLRDQRSGCPVGRRRHWQTTAVSVNLVPARASTAHWSPSIISTQALASQNRDGRRPSNLPRSEASGFVQQPEFVKRPSGYEFPTALENRNPVAQQVASIELSDTRIKYRPQSGRFEEGPSKGPSDRLAESSHQYTVRIGRGRALHPTPRFFCSFWTVGRATEPSRQIA